MQICCAAWCLAPTYTHIYTNAPNKRLNVKLHLPYSPKNAPQIVGIFKCDQFSRCLSFKFSRRTNAKMHLKINAIHEKWHSIEVSILKFRDACVCIRYLRCSLWFSQGKNKLCRHIANIHHPLEPNIWHQFCSNQNRKNFADIKTANERSMQQIYPLWVPIDKHKK